MEFFFTIYLPFLFNERLSHVYGMIRELEFKLQGQSESNAHQPNCLTEGV